MHLGQLFLIDYSYCVCFEKAIWHKSENSAFKRKYKYFLLNAVFTLAGCLIHSGSSSCLSIKVYPSLVTNALSGYNDLFFFGFLKAGFHSQQGFIEKKSNISLFQYCCNLVWRNLWILGFKSVDRICQGPYLNQIWLPKRFFHIFIFKCCLGSRVCIYPKPTQQTKCDTNSLKKIDLNRLSFSFPSPRLVAVSRFKKSVCSTILLLVRFIPFCKGIISLFNVNSSIQDLNLGCCVHFLRQ